MKTEEYTQSFDIIKESKEYEYLCNRYKKLKNKDDINIFEDIELYDYYEVYEVGNEGVLKKCYTLNYEKLKKEVIKIQREQKINKLGI